MLLDRGVTHDLADTLLADIFGKHSPSISLPALTRPALTIKDKGKNSGLAKTPKTMQDSFDNAALGLEYTFYRTWVNVKKSLLSTSMLMKRYFTPANGAVIDQQKTLSEV